MGWRDATRQLQINAPAAKTSTAFAAAICQGLVMITDAATCAANLTYAVQSADQVTGFAGITPAAISGAGALPNTFFSGVGFGANVNFLVQACWSPPLQIPFGSGILTADAAGKCLYSVGAARVEPYADPPK